MWIEKYYFIYIHITFDVCDAADLLESTSMSTSLLPLLLFLLTESTLKSVLRCKIMCSQSNMFPLKCHEVRRQDKRPTRTSKNFHMCSHENMCHWTKKNRINIDTYMYSVTFGGSICRKKTSSAHDWQFIIQTAAAADTTKGKRTQSHSTIQNSKNS